MKFLLCVKAENSFCQLVLHLFTTWTLVTENLICLHYHLLEQV